MIDVMSVYAQVLVVYSVKLYRRISAMHYIHPDLPPQILVLIPMTAAMSIIVVLPNHKEVHEADE